ncbi:FtsX-like permease family protein [Actinoplanes sp. DH11]|uniref:FtsX-like permease family protein n=1 Tax=Actinoplanes sp. DH11 TaxID=2857011 RepID=UPI001E50A467|nr:FtsX-like permease family protein [Actinoplanes sp. DH11]
MALIVRRAAAAKGLLAAGAAVMFIAALLLAGLTAYAGAAVEAGVRAAVAAAAPAERSVLVRGAAGEGRDEAVRVAYAGSEVSGASYASGWAITNPGGGATPDANGVVYADVVAVDELRRYADLTAGAWPAGAGAALAEPVAKVLGVTAGDTVRLLDRRTEEIVPVEVAGLWRPKDVNDPFWLLLPDVFSGRLPQTATHGPIVVSREVFEKRFATGASAGWLVRPDLSGATLDSVARTSEEAAAVAARLPEESGLGTSATITTGLSTLADRLERADLVRRSALVTPVLLLAVLGGYALTLVAVLLGEARRAETALLRARGASRRQLAGLAAAEAFVLVIPAALLAPPLAVFLVGHVPIPGGLSRETIPGGLSRETIPGGLSPETISGGLSSGTMPLEPALTASVWLIAALAALGGVVALTVPALRKARTYVAETAGRARLSMFRRAGLDLVVVALAVLGWVQLRQYSSPVGAGVGGVDPLLAAAPTLGVLTGAVAAIRLLPPVARFAGSRLGRGVSRSALLGTWQAGRRAHAGPMVMLALAVAAATVSWAVAGTARTSLDDQAEQQVGADLRVVEEGGAPDDRLAQLTALPGATAVVGAWRESIPLTAGSDPAELVALDTSAAREVMLAREDATGGAPRELLDAMARGRASRMPERVLRPGQITTSGGPVRTIAVFTDGRRLDLGVSTDGRPLRITGSVPGLAGFLVLVPADTEVTWRITGQPGDWHGISRRGAAVSAEDDGTLRVTGGFAVTPLVLREPVPVAMTSHAFTELNASTDRTVFLAVQGVSVPVRVVEVVDRVPGTAGGAAVLADRPALDAALFTAYGIAPRTSEWWVSGNPSGTASLTGVRVLDRRELARAAAADPFGAVSRVALFLAAFGAVLLAAAGIAADSRATAGRRAGELAIMHTLGAGPRLLARSLVVEQAFLAGIGALAGLVVGLLVAAAMVPLLVLTPTAVRPVPEPVLEIGWPATAGSVALLVGVALALSAATAASAARRLPAARLRLGADR